jgi:hypothetical protein
MDQESLQLQEYMVLQYFQWDIHGKKLTTINHFSFSFNTIDLPEYESQEILEEKLLFAIRETSGFGFA